MAMAATRTAEKIRERKLNRMRLGQAVGDVHQLLSDPTISVALVPLLEAEYLQCIETTANRNIPENISGAAVRDRYNTAELLVRACREPQDLTEHMFENVDELTDTLEVNDINFLQDMYFEMVETASPSLDGVSPAELDDLKKALLEINWNELYGRQWYALRRFLLSIMPELLQANLPGSGSILKLIGQNDLDESTLIADLSSKETPAKSAENQ
jgi:hypothetical protein